MLLRRPCCFCRKLFADLEVAIAPCGHEGHNASARQAGPHEKTKCSATTIGTIFSQVSRCPAQFAQKQQEQHPTHEGPEKPHGGRRFASCGLPPLRCARYSSRIVRPLTVRAVLDVLMRGTRVKRKRVTRTKRLEDQAARDPQRKRVTRTKRQEDQAHKQWPWSGFKTSC